MNIGNIPSVIWQKYPAIMPLISQNAIHVWRAPLNLSADKIHSYQSVLSSDELKRAAKFKFLTHQQKFIVARGTLRYLLGQYLDQPPESIVFQYTDRGKPYIAEQSIFFSVSHADDWATYSIGLVEKIGIDVEKIRHDLAIASIAARFFSADENQHLQTLPIAKKTQLFFYLWTCKEAFVKATGNGLTESLSIEIHQEDYLVTPFYVAENYIAALITPTQIDHIQFWNYG